MTDHHGGKLPTSNDQDGGTAAVVPGSISLDQVTYQADGSVSLDEAAHHLGISERTVRRRIKEGTLAAYKLETPRGEVWRIYLPGTSADREAPPWRQVDQDGGDPPVAAAVEDTTPVSNTSMSQELQKALDLIERLQHEHSKALERAHWENAQLAGQVGFLQARVQEQERIIARLMASQDERPAVPAPAPQDAPGPGKVPWWRRLLGHA